VRFVSFPFRETKTIEHKKHPAPKACRVKVLFMDFLEKIIPCHTEKGQRPLAFSAVTPYH